MWKRIWALFMARNIEFYRDKSALGWSILFPFLIVAGFSLIFGNENQNLYKAGLIGKIDSGATEIKHQLEQFVETKFIDIVEFNSRDGAIDKLKHHRIDILIDTMDGNYWVNESSPKGYIVEKMLFSDKNDEDSGLIKQVVQGEQTTYSEWLFPGILGMNMMFSGLFGVGYVVVRYRKNGLLKRLSVTPVRSYEYLAAQIFSRLFIMLATTITVYICCVFLYDFHCRGSYFTLLIVFFAGAFSMISIGLLIAARISSEELAGGLLNLISWPMMFLSGVWFSLEGTSPWVQWVSKIFPLTHLIECARKIMNDGAGLSEIKFPLIALIFMSALFIFAGSVLFEWTKD